jgi:5-formyltetrahydrofolate cyclo-ligase
MSDTPRTEPLGPNPSWDDVRRWRSGTRDDLIRRRAALPAETRRELARSACAHLEAHIDLSRFPILGFYWPIRAEFDVRPLIERHLARGGAAALPVVIQPAAPLEYWSWRPGIAMQTGVWNIPIPKLRERVQPDAVIAPLVGYDLQGYRLGYGGGYFDRTLAAASPRPFCIGLGYHGSGLETIHPQPHDIPMDRIVTERGAVPQNL